MLTLRIVARVASQFKIVLPRTCFTGVFRDMRDIVMSVKLIKTLMQKIYIFLWQKLRAVKERNMG